MTRLGWGLSLVGAVAVLALAGPPLAGRAPAPDPAGAALVPPGTRMTIVTLADGRQLAADQVTPAGGELVISGRGRERRVPAAEVRGQRSFRFWLGSDRYGRDVLRQLLAGGRVSLAVAGLAVLVALVLGAGVGLAAASGGAVLDGVLMRLVDAALAFPVLFLMILAATLFRPGVPLLIVILGATSWMGLARLVRGQVLSLRDRPFVLAARAGGTPWYRIWAWHYAPNIAAPVSQDLALRTADLVVAEATLSYLGLGLPPSAASWGSMVEQGQRSLLNGWWLATLPGLAIAVLVIGLTLIGDGLQLRLGTDA